MSRAPVALVAAFDDPADWFDLAFLVRSPDHELVGVVAPESVDLANFEAAAGVAVPRVAGVDALPHPASVVVTSDYGRVDPRAPGFRETALRLFVVGGQAKSLPIDPRLKERHPERFDADPRVGDPAALSSLVTSGEAVIWLPRDICLWRYAAPQILETGADALTRWLVALCGGDAALLSSTPAFCLAAAPDPTLWLRYFRTSLAAIGPDLSVDLSAARPNAYVVVAIDGFGIGRRVTAVLRAAE